MVTEKRLKLKFRGRVIDLLGIDMYQSPVAAVAEMVSNSWDADAERVTITLPTTVGEAGELVIEDDGHGMTFDECQTRFLVVGHDKRAGDADARSRQKKRRLMGRKGIGKFAGFGIAGIVEIDTVSEETGEHTRFQLDIEQLRGEGNELVDEPTDIAVVEYEGPDQGRKATHGTTVRLKRLSMAQKPSETAFVRSMARRFTLLGRTDDFNVIVGNTPITAVEDVGKVEFDFPRDYDDKEKPGTLVRVGIPTHPVVNGQSEPPLVDGPWGEETLTSGRKVRWRVQFYKDPIDEEDVAGISVFAHGKIAQVPFLFNLTGGLGGQHGAAYMSGQVEADFIDEQARDLIATERQRVNWQAVETQELLEWGQTKIKQLLRIWREKRSEAKVDALDARVKPYSVRLAKFLKSERDVIKKALRNIAKIDTLSDDQFSDLADSMVKAWESGRLKELTEQLAEADDLDPSELVGIMAEAQVLTALHAAESVRAQLNLVRGLQERIEKRELENAVRDYIADNPWLISKEWSTFKIEKGVKHVVEAAAKSSGLSKDALYVGRIDLVLSSGGRLLIVEFMRPGTKVDYDHISRFERYIRDVRTQLRAVTGGQFQTVDGILVADALAEDPSFLDKIGSMEKEGMRTLDWDTLLQMAVAQWRDYLDILVDRAPDDPRVAALKDKGMSPAKAADGNGAPAAPVKTQRSRPSAPAPRPKRRAASAPPDAPP